MIPAFVPLIGSSFDSLGQQAFAWQGFNQKQDAENVQRAQAQDRAANEYFTRLQQMQSDENARRDRLDMTAQEEARRQAESAAGRQFNQQQSAESKREFERRQDLADKEFQWNKDYQDRQLGKEQRTRTNYANEYAPEFHDTGKAFEDSVQAEKDAERALITKASALESEKDWPSDKVHFDLKSHEFVRKELSKGLPVPLDDKQTGTIQAANKELAGLSSDYQIAKEERTRNQTAWTSALGEVRKYGLVHKKVNGHWVLYDPETGQTYGKADSERKSAYDPTEDGKFVPTPAQPRTDTPPLIPQTTMTPATAGVLSGLASGFIGATTGAQIPAVMTPRFIPQGGSTGTTPPPLSSPVPPMTVAAPATPTMVTTQAQFDALQPGAIYIGRNGRKYQKPYAQDERQ